MTKYMFSDFGHNADQVLLLMESLLETHGHFLQKNFTQKFSEYHQNGIKDLNRPPIMLNATNSAVLSNPIYKSSPVMKKKKKGQPSNRYRINDCCYYSNKLQLKFGNKKII